MKFHPNGGYIKSRQNIKLANMLFSYRHPDLAASGTGHSEISKLSDHETSGLEERRRFVRSIPVPTVIERDDAEAWELWTQAVKGPGL